MERGSWLYRRRWRKAHSPAVDAFNHGLPVPEPTLYDDALRAHALSTGIACGSRWSGILKYSFGGDETQRHINLQELKADINEVDARARVGCRDVRLLFINDSQVVVGCLAKGRSSSRALNRLMRRCLGLRLCAGLQLDLIWVGTSFNVADYPSRGVAYPS